MPGQGDGLLPSPKGAENDDKRSQASSKIDDRSSGRFSAHSNRICPEADGVSDEKTTLDHPGTGSGSGGNSGADDAPGDGPKLAELPDGGGEKVVVSQPELAQSVPMADQSAEPKKQTDSADKSVLPADKSAKKVLDFTGFKSRRLTSQSIADFDKKLWKRSRIKSGWLIRRMAGYSIVENEYGVQYLGVVSRKPDKMSADSVKYPLAGFFTWTAMIKRTLLVEERGQQDVRTKLG